MKTATEKREFTRVPIHLNVEFSSPQRATSSVCQLKDVSMNGVYVHCDNPLPIGSDCKITVILGSEAVPIRIEVSGKIARVDADGMGMEITEIVGIESFEHLRNLVLYNSPNVDQVEQEFHEHVGIKRKN